MVFRMVLSMFISIIIRNKCELDIDVLCLPLLQHHHHLQTFWFPIWIDRSKCWTTSKWENPQETTDFVVQYSQETLWSGDNSRESVRVSSVQFYYEISSVVFSLFSFILGICMYFSQGFLSSPPIFLVAQYFFFYLAAHWCWACLYASLKM